MVPVSPEEQKLLAGQGGGGEQKSAPWCSPRCGTGVCVGLTGLVASLVFVSYRLETWCVGPMFHDDDVDMLRPQSYLEAEAKRREAAINGGVLWTVEDLPSVKAVGVNAGAAQTFPYFNFVQGFQQAGCWEALKWRFGEAFGTNEPRWKPPVQGEKMGIVTYQEMAEKNFGHGFPFDFFEDFFTGEKIPSWEDDGGHSFGVGLINAGMKAARAVIKDFNPMTQFYSTDDRVAFDNKALLKMASDGFRYFGPMETKYAANGMYGAAVVEREMEKQGGKGDVLGLLMTDSVFGAHLVQGKDGKFTVDLSSMSKYKPMKGYAALGGKATFERRGSTLQTVKLEYNGSTFTDFDSASVREAYETRSTRTGWRMAEGAFISSLLSQTNLVMHVKDLHLEIAAAFQATTVDTFANKPKHPVRRLLDAFIHRSVQATNDNFRLLFDYHAAEFSLAPLSTEEQLKLIDEAIVENPLNLADLDMERYGTVRNMNPEFSTKDAITNSSKWGWRWHYRALTVQRLLVDYVKCWLEAEGVTEQSLQEDSYVKDWWQALIAHLPSFRRASKSHPAWAPADLSKITKNEFAQVVGTIMVWVSWIHEDVGHSAASYVYNPIYTPMNVPEDGVGVPMNSWVFNALAYRGFVFLHRSTLLQEPPDFWFDGNAASRKCFTSFQDHLKWYGDSDIAFSQCEQDGFYSCVGRVETAVSS